MRRTMKFSCAVTGMFLFIAFVFPVGCRSTRARCTNTHTVNIRVTDNDVTIVDPEHVVFVNRGDCVRLHAVEAPRGSRLRVRRIRLLAASEASDSSAAASMASSSNGTVASTDSETTISARQAEQTSTDTCRFEVNDECVIETDATAIIACLEIGGVVNPRDTTECDRPLGMVLECGATCDETIRGLWKLFEKNLINSPTARGRYDYQVQFARDVEAARLAAGLPSSKLYR